VHDFGLTDEQFWRLTPARFAALSERHEQAERRADLRAGVVASTVANVHRDDEKKPDPFTAEDFFPDPYEPEEGDPPKPRKAAIAPEMTPEQILRHMKAAFPKRPKAVPPSEAHG
jgi:hypothetical protein